jgi:hypothetical protein
MDLPSCLVMVQGLGERKKTTRGDVLYIHVSVNISPCMVRADARMLDFRDFQLW